jgi:predicted signal transduction protein with EAL and GGDEF domain
MEGVENPDEVEILRGFNCDVIQGYVFARPAPASQALAFARDPTAKAGAPGVVEAASANRRTLSAAG